MQRAAPPQYLPDGRWWWNGRAWTPVTWPVPTAGDAWDDSTYAEEPRRRAPAVLWLGLIAVLVLLVLAFGASAAAWVAQQGIRIGAPPAPVPAAPATAAPAQPTPTTGGGSTSDYRQVVLAGVASFQSAGQSVADRCARAALRQGTADCRAALQALDDSVKRFQTDLAGTQVPACMQPANRELRTALALYHQGIQQELQGIDDEDVGAVAQGASTLRHATNHAQDAGSLLQASC